MQPPEVLKGLADITVLKNMFRLEPYKDCRERNIIFGNHYSSQPRGIACDLQVLSKRWSKNLLTKLLQKDMGNDVFFWTGALSKGAN
jgi:hypothetical protein